MEIIAGIFLIAGLFLIFVAAIGILRLPDFYSRLHASGLSETLGMVLCFIGLIIYEGFTFTSVKLLIIALFFFLANPIGTLVISRAAYRSGLKPWTRKGV